MDYLSNTPAMPAEYYRRQAARVRRLADEATTPAIKGQLRQTAREYERLAERVASEDPAPAS
jgi:hypothetical protein